MCRYGIAPNCEGGGDGPVGAMTRSQSPCPGSPKTPRTPHRHGLADGRFSDARRDPDRFFMGKAAGDPAQGEGQWERGREWTGEEKSRFIEVAARYGVGDKWGLFSTHMPGRTGEECHAFYKVLVAEGVIWDDRFMTNPATGKVIEL
jgi:hypothetical protein